MEYQKTVVLSKNHVYRYEGQYRVGVTTAIKNLDAPFLDQWRVKVQVQATARAAFLNPPIENEPIADYESRLARLAEKQYEHERLSDEAAQLGTEIHSLIEHHCKHSLGIVCEVPFVSDEAQDAFVGWKAWAKDADMVPLMAEARVVHLTDDYAGTVDLVCLYQGRPTQLDWKPLKDKVFPEQRLQSSGYRKALQSMGWPEMDGLIVAIARDGSRRIKPVLLESGEELEETYQIFLGLVRTHRWLKDLDKVKDRKARIIDAAEAFQKHRA